MREIKFRVWGAKLGMFYVDEKSDLTLTFGDPIPMVAIHCSDGVMDGFNADYVMQYTGLNDKNGKDIFEGDVVRILYTDWPSNHTDMPLDEYKKSISYRGEVVFNNNFGYAEYELANQDSRFSLQHGAHGEFEVIGNIYENPELLEAQS